MLPLKFIIYDDELLLGRVKFHRNLLPDDFDHRLVYGGGMFELDHENKTVNLFGRSHDFGRFIEARLVGIKPIRGLDGYDVRVVD